MRFRRGYLLFFLNRRLLNSKVLIISLNGCNAELAKNTILAGANISVSDDNLVTQVDVDTNFLYYPDDIGLNRAEVGVKKLKEINPLVRFEVLPAIDVNKAHKALVLQEEQKDFSLQTFDKYSIIVTSTKHFQEIVFYIN
jgi:molybdopterin/thiamine biosynthesis adenylyltransferase